jgi:hypothetical protein
MSTALMYSFAQRPDMQVVDEPFYAHYLLNNPEANHPGRDEIIASQPNELESIFEQLEALSKQKGHLFIKNMAHHLVDIPMDHFKGWEQVFFIRHPERIINSYTKVIHEPTIKDIGIQDVFYLFKQFRESNGQKDLRVLSSIELVKDPEVVLTTLCEQLSIPFYPSMLEWTAGARDEDGVWAKYWYRNVHNSTGFSRKYTEPDRMPERYNKLLQMCLPMYDDLFQYCIKT